MSEKGFAVLLRDALRIQNVTEEMIQCLVHGILWARPLLSGSPVGRGVGGTEFTVWKGRPAQWGKPGWGRPRGRGMALLCSHRGHTPVGRSGQGGNSGTVGSKHKAAPTLGLSGADWEAGWKKSAFSAQPHKLEKPGPEPGSTAFCLCDFEQLKL